MIYLIEKVVRFPEPETVRAAGPPERDLTLTDQAKFFICNHTIEQDHRAVKRITRPMLGFNSFWAVRCMIAGIEVMYAIHKGQMVTMGNVPQTPVEQFYSFWHNSH